MGGGVEGGDKYNNNTFFLTSSCFSKCNYPLRKADSWVPVLLLMILTECLSRWCMVAWCTQNVAPRRHQLRMARAI